MDLKSELVVTASGNPRNAADTGSPNNTAADADVNLDAADCENEVEVIGTYQVCHSTNFVMQQPKSGMQAYIPERASPASRRWTGKNPA